MSDIAIECARLQQENDELRRRLDAATNALLCTPDDFAAALEALAVLRGEQ